MLSNSVRPEDPLRDLADYVASFEAWLGAAPAEVDATRQPMETFADRVDAMSVLLGALYHAGWARYGWPEDLGGLGGSILHRAAMWEALARHGVPSMALFEHLEVLGPTLVALGPPGLVRTLLPKFLAGEERWAQGFSEPNAGSDLADLRTRGVEVDGGFAVSGRKVWTSWAKYARWCLVLVRTGSADSRHRGLTALVVDLHDPRVEVSAIEQANGTDELAEVVFDEVFVPETHVIGAIGDGWQVAMHILGHERGTYAWFRHCFLNNHLAEHARRSIARSDAALGESMLDLVAVAAASAQALRTHQSGDLLGPHAAFTKLLLCNAEQHLFDWIRGIDATAVWLTTETGAHTSLQQDYLFSRIVTIYGGSQQMQLETIAKRILRLP